MHEATQNVEIVGYFERKFQWEWGVAHQRQWASENLSPNAITWR